MQTKAKIEANKKYLDKVRKNGDIKQFTAYLNIEFYNNLDRFVKDKNISKAELLRRISGKIDDGTLSDFLNL